jgi:hypothetical protein
LAVIKILLEVEEGVIVAESPVISIGDVELDVNWLVFVVLTTCNTAPG